MSKGLPQAARDHLEKCKFAAIAAVEAYNRPGPRFRTAQYIVFIVLAWSAFFHALFYRRGRRPWLRERSSGTGKRIRYIKIDGEPKHWDLSECLNQYFNEKNPPERKNLEFLIGLRNKVEHRHLPDLDISLYGECQAALMNLEEYIANEFGPRYALTEQLAVSLQFSRTVPDEKARITRLLASNTATSIREYIERFRSSLPEPILASVKYSFSVYLVPRVVNRKSAADAAVQFVKIDEASAEELERLQRLNVLIKEKHIPIANLNLFRPKEVIKRLKATLTLKIDQHVHTCAWRFFAVRPPKNTPKPEATLPEYCVFDPAHNDYLYTEAWIAKLTREFADVARYEQIIGRSNHS